MAGLLVSAVAPPAAAEIVSRTFFDPVESAWGIYQEPVGTDLSTGSGTAHPSRWIDFDNDGIAELEIRGKGPGDGGGGSININTSTHTQVLAADNFSETRGGFVLPVPQTVPIGDDAVLHLYEGLPDVGWHHHWDFGFFPPNPFIGNEEDYYPSLMVTGGGLTSGWGNVVTGYFGELAGTPPFDEMLYIGFRFGEEGAWNYGWLHINILGGWEGYVSGWAYETELNTPIRAGAIPEPASAVLLAGALALAVAGARRRCGRSSGPVS